jgi:hypothetical protein
VLGSCTERGTRWLRSLAQVQVNCTCALQSLLHELRKRSVCLSDVSLQCLAAVITRHLHRCRVIVPIPVASVNQAAVKKHRIWCVDDFRVACQISRISAPKSLAHHSRSWSNRGASRALLLVPALVCGPSPLHVQKIGIWIGSLRRYSSMLL